MVVICKICTGHTFLETLVKKYEHVAKLKIRTKYGHILAEIFHPKIGV